MSPAQLRSGFPVFGNPGSKKKAVSLAATQFRYGFGNALTAEESIVLFEQHAIPSPGRPLFEAVFASLSKNSPPKVANDNEVHGPLLLISGQAGSQRPPTGATPLTVDHGWHTVAAYALGWLDRRGVRPVADSLPESTN